MTHPHSRIFKITTAELWQEAQAAGIVPPSPVDVADGYMHMSTLGQLRETLRLHFRGQTGLRVLSVATGEVEPHVKWEPSRGGDLFPHIYAPLPLVAVEAVNIVSVDADGVSDLPPGFA